MSRRKLIFRLGLVALVAVILTTALTGGGRDRGQFMFSEELQPGMTGFCKTAVNGNQIVTFNFTIVDILRTAYVGLDPRAEEYKITILARAEEGFWTAAGMSGSPCYIDDKLIGALFASYSWDTPLTEPGKPFLIQPIEAMLPVLDACLSRVSAPASGSSSASAQLGPVGRTIQAVSLTGKTEIERIKVVARPPAPEELEAHPRTLFVQYLATPVAVSGLSGRAYRWLKEGMDAEVGGSVLRYLRGERAFQSFLSSLRQGLEERYDVELYNFRAGGQVQGVDPGPLVPGAPVGSAIMLGDFTYGGYGTVTYVEDQCLIAYGHPDFFLGETDLFMTSIYITDLVRSIQRPFKEGYIVGEVGSLLEDRLHAIAGAIGRPTTAIQLNLTVTDRDSGITNTFTTKSVALPEWYPDNLLWAGLEAVDRTLNRVGRGTLNMHLTIRGAAGEKLLERRDIYVSNYDISEAGTFDPAWISYLLAWNEFADPQISAIDLEMTVERNLRVKVIESVEPASQSVSRGGTLRYNLKLQPYRGAQETITGSLKIPDWANQDDVVYLEAFPANWAFWKFEMQAPWARPYFLWDTILDLDGLIEAIQGAWTNDAVLVVAWSSTTGRAYAIDIKSVGDFFVDGDRESEKVAQVR
ncbi:MAG: hypothetical protein NUW06_05320 [Candidatus Acetothermia bacterium]|jgi:hypothetical protein|nr:hypothetical protein [Candidatus Acetothermia bacterium]MDH7505569.1 hypothetical protein [Candidatus Acetothermia bacterium]